jgi:AAA domain-containing protein
MPNRAALAAADATVAEVLNAALWCQEPAVLVTSPPGAGKTGTVERVAAVGVLELGLRVMVAVQTNAQVVDLLARLARNFPAVPVWHFHRWNLPEVPALLRGLRNVRSTERARDLPPGPCVVVATSSKWAETDGVHFDLMVVDEAYQLREALYIQFSGLADRVLFIGDPGQLDPFTQAEIERWRADPAGPHRSCVAAFIARRGRPRSFSFPVSRRLDQGSVALVQPAFYPALPFEAAALPGERQLRLPVAGIGPVDRAVTALGAGPWSYLELPEAHAGMIDDGVVAAIAGCVHALLDRGAEVRDEHGTRPLTPDRIAVGCAHTAQTTAVRRRLRQVASQVTVETANRLQGQEFDVTIVYHPLAGRTDATAFHLDAGRLCVLLSRHRLGCLIVGRAGVADLLAVHAPAAERILGLDDDPEYDGWQAHLAVLDRLARTGAIRTGRR